MRNKLIAALVFLFAFNVIAAAQTKPLHFIRYVNTDAEVSQLYDSVNLPLLVVGKAVYIIDADCISTQEKKSDSKHQNARNEGGDVAARKPRNEGGDVTSRNARNNGGDVTAKNTRNEGGDVAARNARNAGGDVTSRNTRNEGGDVSSRNARNEGGDTGNGCGCAINDQGKFILYVPSIHKKEEMRVYYNHSFIDKKQFTIKTI